MALSTKTRKKPLLKDCLPGNGAFTLSQAYFAHLNLSLTFKILHGLLEAVTQLGKTLSTQQPVGDDNRALGDVVLDADGAGDPL